MASFVHQTSRSLLFIVAFLLIIGCCFGEDDQGPRSKSSTESSTTTSSKAETNESGMKKKPNVLLYVLIGVLAFVIVLLVIIVVLVVLLCQRRRRRSRDSTYGETESAATSYSLESVLPTRTKPKGAGVPTKAKGYGVQTKAMEAGATMPKDSRWVPREFRSNMPMPKEKLESFWPAATRAKGAATVNATAGRTMAKGTGTDVHQTFSRGDLKTKGAATTAKASAGHTKTTSSNSNVYVW
uniref:Uncharacterized protein n=1 Tax=Globodera rostochiensis TaxID=31243 RepID=A0A914HYA5_GLORO